MFNKILFLDVDGCLNSDVFNERKGHCAWWEKLDPSAFLKLNAVVRRTNCDIVMSSTWRRHFELKDLQDLFQASGFLYPDSIIDKTPDFGDPEFGVIDYFIGRGQEILAWLAQHPTTTFAVVDDNRISYDEELLKHFVWTNSRIGMTDKDVEKLVSILGEDTKKVA